MPEPTETVVTVENRIDDASNTVEDIQELTRFAALSDERQTSILERLAECQSSLQQLSSQTNQAESPVLLQMSERLTQIETELANLKSSTQELVQAVTSQSSQQQQPSTVEPTIVESVEPAMVVSTVEPAQVEPESPPAKRRRVNVL